jgi:hypothetical protein
VTFQSVEGMMAALTIELSKDTAARLEREAERRGMDVQTYVRLLLGDHDSAKTRSRDPEPNQEVVRQLPSPDDDLSWLESPGAVVATIRTRGPGRSPVQEATADLAELLRSGGVDPGISPAEWDRRWAEYEARQKARDLADTEKTLREMRQLPAEDDDAR